MYISSILGGCVKDSSDVTVGHLLDFLIQPVAGEYPSLRFLLIRKRDHTDCFLPYEYVATLSGEGAVLKNLWKTVPLVAPPQDAVWLKRDVLDQQIVDVAGARVVRVNDLKLGLFEEQMCVLGIDVSFKGILRRLGLSRFDFFNVLPVNLIDWRKAQPLKGGILKLDTISKDLIKLHPADLANIVEDLSLKQGSRLVRSLGPEAAAHVLEELNPHLQKTLIKYLGPERAAGILEQMSPDEVVDLMKRLPHDEARQFLSYFTDTVLAKVEKLIRYPSNTAGGLMVADYVSARPEWTVAETTAEIRHLSPRLRSISHIYITDQDGRFKGSVSLRRLLLAKPTEVLKNIMKRLHRRTVLKLDQSTKEVIRVMTKYDLYTAAVIDDDHKLVGVVTIDDVMRYLVPDA